MWTRIIWLFIMFLLGKHICFPSSSRYLELADSADFYIAHENWEKAEKVIIEALRLEPANFSNSLLFSNLGIVQAAKGEYSKAIQSLSLGLDIAPSSSVLLNNRAHTFLMIDSVANAVKDLDRSLQIDSIQEWTLVTRAFLYLQNKEIKNASKLFSKASYNFPNNSSVFAGLAALSELEQKYNDAKNYYKMALTLNHLDDETRESYIMLLIKTDDYTKARAEIKEALFINSEYPMFYLLRGYLHRLNYRMEEALADKKIAISKGIDKTLANSYIP